VKRQENGIGWGLLARMKEKDKDSRGRDINYLISWSRGVWDDLGKCC
jgi:hypothetical protein